MTRWILVLLTAALAAAPTAGATTSTATTVVIRHQTAHCHTWSVNRGPFAAAQRLNLQRGSTISFTNNDVMPHRLIELAGPRVAMPGAMNHMGATTSIKLARPGVYRFGTRAGEDYMAGIKTTGADNVLTLTVTVR
jgi:plastocyanin